jgi:hypothetical protein
VIFELEGWTNDRISAELGVLHTIPRDEWITGRPMAAVVMAAFCHPRPNGGRFNDPSRGVWYAGFALRTAHAEVIYHRTRELEDIGGWFDTFVQMAAYLTDFDAPFHDLRARRFSRFLNPDSYAASQRLGSRLRDQGSNGIVYPSVRDRPSVRGRGGTCLACFRPRLVRRVRQGGFYESAPLENAEAGIRINAVCPGPVDTPMMERITNNKGQPGRKDFEAFVPMRRLAVPQEIANAVLWPCSAQSSYVTGTTMRVDGGERTSRAPLNFPILPELCRPTIRLEATHRLSRKISLTTEKKWLLTKNQLTP